MRLLSLAAVAATLCFVGAGLAQSGSAPTPVSRTAVAKALVSHRILGPTEQRAQTGGSIRYIVRFKDAPVALYSGGIAGLQATSPHVTGARHLDTRSHRYALTPATLNPGTPNF